MRIRQVKPAFWVDKTMAAMTPAVRLTFIGLWMLADDEGFIDWDLEQAAAELYPFESVHRRERVVGEQVATLVERGRVHRYPDCSCLFVPHLKEHQRVSGVRSTRNRDTHAKHLPLSPKPDPLSDSPGTVRVGNGRERNGTVGRAGAREGASATTKRGDGELYALVDLPSDYKPPVQRPQGGTQ